MPRAIWSHDLGPTFVEQNMYGSHPAVLALESGASGVKGGSGRPMVKGAGAHCVGPLTNAVVSGTQ